MNKMYLASLDFVRQFGRRFEKKIIGDGRQVALFAWVENSADDQCKEIQEESNFAKNKVNQPGHLRRGGEESKDESNKGHCKEPDRKV